MEAIGFGGRRESRHNEFHISMRLLEGKEAIVSPAKKDPAAENRLTEAIADPTPQQVTKVISSGAGGGKGFSTGAFGSIRAIP